jgi:hypothetical protein
MKLLRRIIYTASHDDAFAKFLLRVGRKHLGKDVLSSMIEENGTLSGTDILTKAADSLNMSEVHAFTDWWLFYEDETPKEPQLVEALDLTNVKHRLRLTEVFTFENLLGTDAEPSDEVMTQALMLDRNERFEDAEALYKEFDEYLDTGF